MSEVTGWKNQTEERKRKLKTKLNVKIKKKENISDIELENWRKNYYGKRKMQELGKEKYTKYKCTLIAYFKPRRIRQNEEHGKDKKVPLNSDQNSTWKSLREKGRVSNDR